MKPDIRNRGNSPGPAQVQESIGNTPNKAGIPK